LVYIKRGLVSFNAGNEQIKGEVKLLEIKKIQIVFCFGK